MDFLSLDNKTVVYRLSAIGVKRLRERPEILGSGYVHVIAYVHC